jgi:hypothetical protein
MEGELDEPIDSSRRGHPPYQVKLGTKKKGFGV